MLFFQGCEVASFLGGEKCGMEKSDSSPPSSTRLFNSIICALTQTHEFSEREERGKFVPGNEMKEKKSCRLLRREKIDFFQLSFTHFRVEKETFFSLFCVLQTLSLTELTREKREASTTIEIKFWREGEGSRSSNAMFLFFSSDLIHTKKCV